MEQQEPNSLIVKWLDQPTQIFRAGVGYKEPLSSFATHNLRLRVDILKDIWKHLETFTAISLKP